MRKNSKLVEINSFSPLKEDSYSGVCSIGFECLSSNATA